MAQSPRKGLTFTDLKVIGYSLVGGQSNHAKFLYGCKEFIALSGKKIKIFLETLINILHTLT